MKSCHYCGAPLDAAGIAEARCWACGWDLRPPSPWAIVGTYLGSALVVTAALFLLFGCASAPDAYAPATEPPPVLILACRSPEPITRGDADAITGRNAELEATIKWCREEAYRLTSRAATAPRVWP